MLTQSSLYLFCICVFNSLQKMKALTLMLYVAYRAGYIFFCFLLSHTKTVYSQSFFLLSGHSLGNTCSYLPVASGSWVPKRKDGVWMGKVAREIKSQDKFLIKAQCLLISLSLWGWGAHLPSHQNLCFVRISALSESHQENRFSLSGGSGILEETTDMTGQ